MGATTGPIIAAGAVTLVNHTILDPNAPSLPTLPSASRDPVTVRIVIATAIAGAGLRLWEEFMPRTAAAVAWLALVSTLLVRIDPTRPSPLENLATWYGKG